MNKAVEDIDKPPPKKDGSYIFGLFIEGARYDPGTKQLEDSYPKEMFSVMPVVWCRAYVFVEGKKEKGIYQCPVYKTVFRGPTFVFRC